MSNIELGPEQMAWAKRQVGELIRIRTDLADKSRLEAVIGPAIMTTLEATQEDMTRLPALMFAFTQFGWMLADFLARAQGRQLDVDEMDHLIDLFRHDTKA